MALLDRSSEEYRVVAGLIRSAQRRVGATESQRWNGDIAVLSPLSRQRSRSDLDGTIHLHPRNVIGPLMRAQAGQGGRWWYPRAARDAAYNVIYEALRQSSKTAVDPPPAEPGKSLDSVLAPGARSLDMALAEQRTYEITHAVMSDNGMAHAYSDDPPEATAIAGHGLSAGAVTPFRLTPFSTTTTAAARGFVDGVQAASGLDHEEVFDRLLTEAKGSRWSQAFKLVADQRHPGLLSELPAERQMAVYRDVSRQAVREWSRESSARRVTISTVDAASEWGYAIGRDTADLVVGLAQDLDKPAAAEPTEEASRSTAHREMSPSEIFGAQAPLTAVTRPSSTPTASPGTTGAEQQTPRIEK
ncbi:MULTISPECIES: hypothetical protein [unclassified Kribbella]|uniref:hypothetical protein n=1 Tax=unclassified Kribbella TaxID=2644121 RepID=UPI003018751F